MLVVRFCCPPCGRPWYEGAGTVGNFPQVSMLKVFDFKTNTGVV